MTPEEAELKQEAIDAALALMEEMRAEAMMHQVRADALNAAVRRLSEGTAEMRRQIREGGSS